MLLSVDLVVRYLILLPVVDIIGIISSMIFSILIYK